VAFFSNLASTLARALSTIRNPSRGIKRALAKVAYSGAARIGKTVGQIKEWAVETVIAGPAEDFPSDIIETVSSQMREGIFGRIDVQAKVPRALIIEARIKESRSYLVTWKIEKQFEGQRGSVETYVSGYFDEERTPEEWWREYEEALGRSKYETDYTILSRKLARVMHRVGAEY